MSKNYITDVLEKVRKDAPLVHCITNYVTANDCANIILAIGGIPTMADSIVEVEEVTAKASALVLNIGTLSEEKLRAMILAGKTANKNNVPIVFDPVGVASINARKEAAFKILEEVKPTVIRGNMAEIKTLLGLNGNSKGVDSLENIDRENASEIAKKLAVMTNTIVAITGEKDYISDGKKVIVIENGNKMMTKVTGTGCMTTSLIAAFLGVLDNGVLSAILGISSIGVAGEKAYEDIKENEGNGSYRMKLIDEVYRLTPEELMKRGKISE